MEYLIGDKPSKKEDNVFGIDSDLVWYLEKSIKKDIENVVDNLTKSSIKDLFFLKKIKDAVNSVYGKDGMVLLGKTNQIEKIAQEYCKYKKVPFKKFDNNSPYTLSICGVKNLSRTIYPSTGVFRTCNYMVDDFKTGKTYRYQLTEKEKDKSISDMSWIRWEIKGKVAKNKLPEKVNLKDPHNLKICENILVEDDELLFHSLFKSQNSIKESSINMDKVYQMTKDDPCFDWPWESGGFTTSFSGSKSPKNLLDVRSEYKLHETFFEDLKRYSETWKIDYKMVEDMKKIYDRYGDNWGGMYSYLQMFCGKPIYEVNVTKENFDQYVADYLSEQKAEKYQLNKEKLAGLIEEIQKVDISEDAKKKVSEILEKSSLIEEEKE